MPIPTIEERLATVEQEVERLKRLLPPAPEPRWKQIIGIFKDDPLFDEAERLGREWRLSHRTEGEDDADPPA